MTNKLSIVLTDVPETLLIPLYTRAQETQRADAMLKDETAVEMVNRWSCRSHWLRPRYPFRTRG